MIALRDDEEGSIVGWSRAPVLATERLILRPPHPDDADAYAALANNLKIAAMMTGMPHPYSRTDADSFIARTAEPDGTGCTLAVTDKATGRLLGSCGLSFDKEKRLRIGYWLGEPFWGKGYATEAAHALVDFAFRNHSLTQLNAWCRLSNPASRRVIEKCGFQFIGTGMLSSIAVGQFSAEHFTLDRRVWASLKSWR